MKEILNLFFLFVSSIVISCAMTKPEEIIGEWIAAPDSPHEITYGSLVVKVKSQPTMIFYKDGSFKVDNMPQVLLYGPFPDMTEIISGKGIWNIGEYQGSKVVFLEIKEVNGKKITSATQVQISKFGNNVTLFFWIGEEGGKRFEFIRSAKVRS